MQIIQIGMNTSDIAGSLRLYSEALGFRNAGARALWGSSIEIQALEPDARALLWWMVGAQPFFQLELYHHSNPPQRKLRDDWQPSDHGWVRFGVEVAKIEDTQSVLERNGVSVIATADDERGRRAAFRDPYLGVIVELIEQRTSPEGDVPKIIYVATSVSDLGAARTYYGDVLGFSLMPLDRLHRPTDEALWGLAGAERQGVIVDTGPILIEIVQYERPVGRPRPSDYRGSDQGIVNVGLGSRRKSEIEAAFARLAAAGFTPPKRVEVGDLMTGYITEPDHELELVSVPESLDESFGFVPAADFFR